ncbi:MAG: CHAT domain-containing protein, partial [candidate division KSB1 bacterium]|nr:CHAT domain-containing protein [candidate division KSB1 bacterium]
LAYRFLNSLISPNEAALHQHNLANTLPAVPSFWRGMPQRTGVELPFDPLLTTSSGFGVGHATYHPDDDNVIRRFPIVIAFSNGFYPCLGLEIARRYLDATYALEATDSVLVLQKNSAEPLPIPFEADGDILINFIPATEFSVKYTRSTLPDPLGANFQNAVVLIINSLAENSVATPFGEFYSPWALHASLLSQILASRFIRDDIGDTIISGVVFILLALLWLIGVEYRLDHKKRKTWVMLLALNALLFLFIFIMLCFEIHLIVVAPALMMTTSYLLAKKRLRVRPPVYKPFGLAVLERQGRNYPLQVFESPFGEEEANATFESFLDDETLQKTLQRLKGLSANREDLVWMGNKLFKAIFPEAIDSVLTRSLDAVQSSGAKLRLKLRIDPPELQGLPWELMRSDRLRRGFLAVNKSLPLSVTRYLALEQRVTKWQFRSPIRILVLIAKPAELQPLPGALTEKKCIEKSLFWLRLVREVKLTIREKVTRSILVDELERDPPDILHYIGHSSFDPVKNKAFLALEPESIPHDNGLGDARHFTPMPEPASSTRKGYDEFEAEELGNLLSDSPVKLVILNSCEGATAAQTDAFVGIAQNLVRVGVPAVVAMQYPIFDQSALTFSRFFYSSFLKTYSIDEAVASARRSLSNRIGLNKQDWATPVLFMRPYDENIFEIA